MNDCIICEEVYPNPNELKSVDNFINKLLVFSKNKSFDIMAREGLIYYNRYCSHNNRHYARQNKPILPRLSKDLILYHLNNCNQCHQHVLYSLFYHTASQANYYKNKINRLRESIEEEEGDVIMGETSETGEEDQNGNNNNNGKLKCELERNTNLFERNVNILLKVDKSINSQKIIV